MSARRAARAAAPLAASTLPRDLAAGPELSRWAPDAPPGLAPFLARRAWRAAVYRWAADEGRDVADWRALLDEARTRHAWDRAHLLAHGHAALVAYLDGRRATPPRNAPTSWLRIP